MLKRLLQSAVVQAALAALFAWWLRFVHRTTRWQLELDPATGALMQGARPIILALWHERLPPLVCQWTQFPDPARGPRQPLHFVISGHRDGRLIAAIAARIGVPSVEGSTSRGGAAALARMLALLASGEASVGITPDGPRGPRRMPQPGVVALAKLSGCPVVAAGAATAHNRRLGSWDRMMLSLPFGKGALVVGPPLAIERGADQAQALAAIRQALDTVTARADSLVGIVVQ
ncbi:MAG: DUF374 domain-containing protein [Acetobacteraceae bacterium]|nr:DUF374 domain-containing protein [Acetobacteraceae bacterium]